MLHRHKRTSSLFRQTKIYSVFRLSFVQSMSRQLTIMMLLTALRTTTQAFSALQYRHAYPRVRSVSLIQRYLSSDRGERTEAELQAIQAERDARKYVFETIIPNIQ